MSTARTRTRRDVHWLWIGVCLAIPLAAAGDRVARVVWRRAATPVAQPLVASLTAHARTDAARRRENNTRTPAMSGVSSDPLPPLGAAAVIQREDCASNLIMFDVLKRPSLAGAIDLKVIWWLGNPRDTMGVRGLLPAWAQQIALRPVPTDALRDLKRLGHRSTPMLIVFDESNRVRLVSQSPRSNRELVGLLRILEGMSWSDHRW